MRPVHRNKSVPDRNLATPHRCAALYKPMTVEEVTVHVMTRKLLQMMEHYY